MQKNLLIILGIFLITIVILTYFYYNYEQGKIKVNQINSDYEYYINNEISGSALMTIINKTIDRNEKIQLTKDKQGKYIENEDNSIKIYIKFLESDKTFDMETISNAGSEAFIQNYNGMVFKCKKVEYHENTKQIKYMLFEQI